MDLLQAWQLVVLPFIAAALGAWFTAHFSLRRFFREKEWERKTQAYTAIFEALHNMRAWLGWAGLGLLVLLISNQKSTPLIDLLDHNGAD